MGTRPHSGVPRLPVFTRSWSSERRLYINRGLGHLTQGRFGVRPEVTVFELQTA